MAVKLSNNATSTLSAAIAANATAVTVQANDAALFPDLGDGDWFPATLVNATGAMEIVRVTARNGATFTIQRGQEGTTAKDFPVGSKIDLRLTVAAMSDLITLIRSAVIDALGFTPVEQGGPKDSAPSKISIGWGKDSALKLKVDDAEFGSEWPMKARDNVAKAGDSMTGSLTVNGDISTPNRVKVGVGVNSSVIEMHDADNSTRFIHNNDGTIGFLGSDGNWTFRASDNGEVQARSSVLAGDAALTTDGNIQGQLWTNWGARDAFNAINSRIEVRATAWANDRVANLNYRLVSFGQQGVPSDTRDIIAPNGAVLVGWRSYSSWKPDIQYWRYPQVFDPVRGWVGFYVA